MLKELRTVKKAAEITGASESFLERLLSEGRLTRYKIKSATYISLVEFESIAIAVKKEKIDASKGQGDIRP